MLDPLSLAESMQPLPSRLTFGRFELQPHERRLLVDGKPAPLGARAFDVLLVLVQRAGHLVTKQQLLDLVWSGVVVEEGNLTVQVYSLRKVLGGDVIATIPGRGYRFIAPVEAELAPPAAPITGVKLKSKLPGMLTPLIGRDDELVELADLIGQHRLVTIVGAGGMGKTLLSQHLLRRQEAAHRHGVCFVELAGITDAAHLPTAIAAALDVRPGGEQPLAGLCSAVAPLALLIVLDNAEHLLDGLAQVVAALLDSAPQVQLLVTSQAPLKLAAERVYRLGPLAVPRESLPLPESLSFGAVALFAERARAADSRFALTESNVATVTELCRALDGVALAIELAAARAPVLGVRTLAESMHARLVLLRQGANRQAASRHQTLRAALEWSHALLSEPERKVFRRLSVLAGSADLELLVHVVADPAGTGDLDPWGTIDALTSLAERSLVAVLPGLRDTTRYRLLESPRALALEKLRDAGEADLLHERHARAMAARFDAAYDDRESGRVPLVEWQDALEPDLANAQQALAWAGEHGDAAVALAVAPTLLLALPRSMWAETHALAERCEALAGSTAPGVLTLRALIVAASTHNQRARRALPLTERAIVIARDLGPSGDAWVYRALCLQAVALAQLHRLDEAVRALEQARSLEHPGWPAIVRVALCGSEVQVAVDRGDGETALRAQQETVRLALAAGSEGLGAAANLLYAELFAGHIDAAIRDGRALVTRLEGTRSEADLAYARVNFTAALLAHDEIDEARRHAAIGWPQAERFEAQPYWADYLALLAALEGRMDDAARLAGYADASYARKADRREGNEAIAFERACTLARVGLGGTEFERLQAEGTALRDEQIGAIAFRFV